MRRSVGGWRNAPCADEWPPEEEPLRVLIAPDKFRGTLTARQAADATAAGWLRARPWDTLDLCPIADGGEGTMATLVDAIGGRVVETSVTAPLGDPVRASFAIAQLGAARVAVVESALASGLALLQTSQLNIRLASSRGFGELIAAALDWEPDRLILCLGGTATNDGGAGMAQALGARLLQANGRPIGAGGEALLGLAAIDVSALDARVHTVSVDACVDVDNPLTGSSGASAMFGPQKGATRADVKLLDRALRQLAVVVRRDLSIDLEHAPGAGAGGGLGFGAMAFLRARLMAGFDVVAEAKHLVDRIDRADLAITGEGRFDPSSLRGKAPSAVLRIAREHGVKAVVICGEVGPRLDRRTGGAMRIVSIGERVGLDRAMKSPRESLELVAEELARSVDDRP